MSDATAKGVRLDKWLWAARIFRTRTAATEACKAGHVKIGGESVKPSREARLGEVLTAQVGPILRTVRVKGLVERRVGPKLVSEFLEDLTPPAEYEKGRAQREPGFQPGLFRPKGAGRPTKKERRALQEFEGGLGE